MEGHGHAGHANETYKLKLQRRPGLWGVPWMAVGIWAVAMLVLIVVSAITGTGLWQLGLFVGLMILGLAQIPDFWGINRWVLRIGIVLLLVVIMAQFINFALIVAAVLAAVVCTMWIITGAKNNDKPESGEKFEESVGDGDYSSFIDLPPPPKSPPPQEEGEKEEGEKTDEPKAAAEPAATSRPQTIVVDGQVWKVRQKGAAAGE